MKQDKTYERYNALKPVPGCEVIVFFESKVGDRGAKRYVSAKLISFQGKDMVNVVVTKSSWNACGVGAKIRIHKELIRLAIKNGKPACCVKEEEFQYHEALMRQSEQTQLTLF